MAGGCGAPDESNSLTYPGGNSNCILANKGACTRSNSGTGQSGSVCPSNLRPAYVESGSCTPSQNRVDRIYESASTFIQPSSIMIVKQSSTKMIVIGSTPDAFVPNDASLGPDGTPETNMRSNVAGSAEAATAKKVKRFTTLGPTWQNHS